MPLWLCVHSPTVRVHCVRAAGVPVSTRAKLHFYNIGVEREPSERERSLAETPESSLWEKTLATELRDMFLARRHAKLVTVPWFEMDALGASDAARAEYLREKLKRDADVDA